jgi:hypothetical protein
MPAAPAQLKPPQIAPRPPAAMPLRARWHLFALAAANRQEIGMHVMPTCHFDDAGRRRLALLNDPKLLDRRPSPPPLRTRQNRNLAHVCSFACKSISKLLQARFSTGRRPSPEGYLRSLSNCGQHRSPQDSSSFEITQRDNSEQVERCPVGRDLLLELHEENCPKRFDPEASGVITKLFLNHGSCCS